MDPGRNGRTYGIVMTVAGIAVMVAAWLFGFTTAAPASAGPGAGSAVDWVSVITAIAGFVLVLTGIVAMFRKSPPPRRLAS